MATIRMVNGHVDVDNGANKIIVADAADAVGVNFSGRCKFFQTERENLPFYCVHSMYNVGNLYKCVVYIRAFGCKISAPKIVSV